jgi:hypothetical protein
MHAVIDAGCVTRVALPDRGAIAGVSHLVCPYTSGLPNTTATYRSHRSLQVAASTPSAGTTELVQVSGVRRCAVALLSRGVTIMQSKLLCVLGATLALFGVAPQASADLSRGGQSEGRS